MEEQQALRQLSVVQALRLQHVGSHSLVLAFGNEGLDALALVLLTDRIECVVESELLDRVEILLLEVGRRHVVVGIHEGKHVLEHTTGSTRGRHELHDLVACGLVLIPSVLILLASRCIGGDDTLTDTGCCLQLQEWEARLKLIQLILNLLLGDTLLSNLL